MELTRFGSLEGQINCTATNSPDVLLKWYNRGVKLNFPKSKRQITVHVSLYTNKIHIYTAVKPDSP